MGRLQEVDREYVGKDAMEEQLSFDLAVTIEGYSRTCTSWRGTLWTWWKNDRINVAALPAGSRDTVDQRYADVTNFSYLRVHAA